MSIFLNPISTLSEREMHGWSHSSNSNPPSLLSYYRSVYAADKDQGYSGCAHHCLASQMQVAGHITCEPVEPMPLKVFPNFPLVKWYLTPPFNLHP